MLKQTLVVFALAVLLLAVAPPGAPAQLSYVYSDSMEPTLATNDGFLIVPSDSIESGDIVTFRTSGRDDYVTHRVVGRSPAGFLTKGDNNPRTDQSVGYAAVERDEIVGTVLTYGGSPVTVPEYGTVVTAISSHRLGLLAGVGLLLLLLSLRTAGRGSRPTRSVHRVRDVLDPLFAVSVLSVIGFVLLGTTVHQLAFVAVATASESPDVLTVGEARTTTFVVDRSASPLTRTVVSADGMRITDRNRTGSNVTVTARIPPPESTGRYEAQLTVRQYPAVFGVPLLRRLERISPAVPATLGALVAVLPPYLLSRIAVDGKAPVRPPRGRWLRRLRGVLR